MHKARKELVAGAVFVAFGLAFAVASARYEIGTALRMGPGYFPLVLGGVLVLLGIAIIVTGLTAGGDEDLGPVPWRAAALLVAAIVFFGVTVRGLGLVPALVVTTLLSALAAHRTGVVAAVAIAAGLTALCVVIFVTALQLPLPLIGPWLEG
jgi:Tripartite tricarboxylate transporter TctB family